MSERILLNEKDASKVLGGVSTSTLQAWRFRGCGPRFIKFGKLVRYDKDTLERWITKQIRYSTSQEVDSNPEDYLPHRNNLTTGHEVMKGTGHEE